MSMPAPLLVFGAAGQVGAELCLLSTSGRPVVGLERAAADITDPAVVVRAVETHRPAVVVNAAAYTAVDAAESDADAAARANHAGPARLATLCAAAGVPLIHVSTDYVFDGSKPAPYVETDPTAPQSVYGATKLAGEQAVLASGAHAIVMRTAWVYSATGKNFIRTMLNAAQRIQTAGEGRLRVVADQHGCPTSADDLAEAILNIAANILSQGWQPDFGGVVHAAGSGATTWHGLALAAFEAASRHGRPVPAVDAIATADYPTPAPRPANSRLDCTRLEQIFGQKLPPWRDSVDRVVDTLLAATVS